VAARAGVSPMTVSRVVNGNGNVRDSTRERVLRAVRELGYTPNLAASSLAAAQATRIALIYTNPSAAYLRELLLGALRGTARTAVQLVIDTWDELDADAERASARALAKSVAGVILPPPLCESKVVLCELAAAGVPMVAIASDRRVPPPLPAITATMALPHGRPPARSGWRLPRSPGAAASAAAGLARGRPWQQERNPHAAREMRPPSTKWPRAPASRR
jgi:DNA-binding LacI/PurR family transcriptional regulator